METEHLRPSSGDHRHDQEDTSAFSGCNCFGSLFSRWGNNNTNNSSESYLLSQQKTEYSSSSSSAWLMEKLKKLKEISEMVAGPKWKNFIRRRKQRRNYNQGSYYNAESYALNFDCGGLDEEDYEYDRAFSSRFASSVPAVDAARTHEGFVGL